MVAFSIFSGVTMTHAGQFVTISEGLAFVSQVLKTFLIAFSIATGISLFILPMTSRRNVFKDLNNYVPVIEASFVAQVSYVRHKRAGSYRSCSVQADQSHGRSVSPTMSKTAAIASAIKGLRSLHEKLHGELSYTRTEIAWGMLSADDLDCILGHLRSVFLPLTGLSMFPEVLQELVEDVAVSNTGQNNLDKRQGNAHDGQMMTQDERWKNLMRPLEQRLESTSELVTIGLRRTLSILKISRSEMSTTQNFVKWRKVRAVDMEAEVETSTTEPEGFSDEFHKKLQRFYTRRQKIHKIWPSLIVSISPEKSQNESSAETDYEAQSECCDVNEELMVFLFMEYLQNEALQAVQDLVLFAENKVTNGSMEYNRLIIPGYDRLKAEGFLNIDREGQKPNAQRDEASGPRQVRDAEHLPPVNFFEEVSNYLQVVPHVMTSPESVFGFRVALASFTVSIMAYMRATQDFFFEQRLIWTLIVIVIGMSPTSGASLFGFAGRIVGTTVSMILSLIVWYIVDGHTAGVLVFLYVANVFEVRQSGSVICFE